MLAHPPILRGNDGANPGGGTLWPQVVLDRGCGQPLAPI
jgi:hypothetical protein